MSRYNAYEGIDTLAQAVDEAKAAVTSQPTPSRSRRSSSKGRKCTEENERRKDAWRPDIAPRSAVHAITVPLLEAEKLRLEKDLAEVWASCTRSAL